MDYAVQLYSVRDALEEDLEHTIPRLAEIGFTRAEPYSFVARATELNAALRSAGITPVSGHAPFLSTPLEPIFKAAEQLGMHTVIDPYVPPERWTTLSDIEHTANLMNAAQNTASQHGLRVGYHNHDFEISTIIDGRTALEHFVEFLHPAVVLEIDAFWVTVGGKNPAEYITTLGDRVRLMHLKDGPLSHDTKTQRPAGQGDMNITAAIHAAPHLELGIVEFDDYTGDIFDGLAQSLRFLEAHDT